MRTTGGFWVYLPNGKALSGEEVERFRADRRRDPRDANHADLRVRGAPAAEYVDDRQLSAWIEVSRETLQMWRRRGESPPHVKLVRRAVRYSVADVRTWIETRGRG